MAIAYFPSLEQADTLEIVFSKLNGGDVTLRLLVDSGFTGESCFVLADNADALEHSQARASQVSGALQGSQKRSVVKGTIPGLSVQFEVLAIFADLTSLVLPPDIKGIVGLRFLRLFRRWGGEKSSDGAWRFFLETNPN
jgi:predicted aspartyl protease